MVKDRYTFGDTEEASLLLKRLAELYETETRESFGAVECKRQNWHLISDAVLAGPQASSREF
jgi:hypothetical protein